MVVRRAARDGVRMAITVQGIFGGALFGLAVVGSTYFLTDEAKRPDLDVATGFLAALIVLVAWFVGVAILSLAWAPVRIHRELARTLSSLRQTVEATENRAGDEATLAYLFHVGQNLRLRTITSEAELESWAAEVPPWTDAVRGELSFFERVAFLDFTGLVPQADFPGAFNPAHSGRLCTLDRQIGNLAGVLQRRGVP